jgi:hypothetical protein
MPQPGHEGKRTCKREVSRNGPFKGPSGYGEWVTRHKGGRGEWDREGNIWGEIDRTT